MSSAKFQLALVTGATAGIGCAVSRLLARQGVTVVLVARSREKLVTLSQEIEEGGGRSVVMECDLTKREDIVRMAASLKEKVGVPDLIINNAGAYCFQRLEDRDYDSWERMINLNIMAYLVVIAEFLGDMKERGSGTIVNITSDSEREAHAGLTVYTGTKFFWAGASQSLRKELQGSPLRLVNILPGFVDTEGLQAMLTDEKQVGVMKDFGMGEAREILDNKDKMLKPEDVAETVWEVVNKPSNVYIQDVMIRDQLQTLL